MSRNSLLVLVLMLGGCDGLATGNRQQHSGEVTVTSIDPVAENASKPVQGVGAPMAWRVIQGAAFYGAAGQPPAFALRCNRAQSAILFERAGGGTALNIASGGVEISLGASQISGGRVQAKTGMTDDVLDRMARPQAQITVSGGPETLTVPGGIAVRRVIDFCRTPPAPPAPEIDNTTMPADPSAPVSTPTPEGF